MWHLYDISRGVTSGWTGWTMSRGTEGPRARPTKMNPLVWGLLTVRSPWAPSVLLHLWTYCKACLTPIQRFSFQPVLHDWCNKGCGMCYRVCGIVHIKEPLLLIGKSSPCGGSGFPLSLSEWSFTVCLTPYNRK